MANPVLSEVIRGNRIESRHRGAVVVVDADCGVVLSLGEVNAPVFPRSAVKAIQALPLIESGAADAFSFGDRELALACASHGGEPSHVEGVSFMLESAGLTGDALECGQHWPGVGSAARELVRNGKSATSLHNNCSGKHAGFLCTCAHKGIAHEGYIKRDHPIQREVIAVLEQLTGSVHGVADCAIDGCSIPTHAVPLKNLAGGFARMATGSGLQPERAKAAKRLLAACMSEPFYVDGTGQPCAELLEAGQGSVFAKNGAEGVYCGAVPALGLGIALKIDDGAMRAAAVVFAAVVSHVLGAESEMGRRYSAMAKPPLLNRNSIKVGQIRPVISV